MKRLSSISATILSFLALGSCSYNILGTVTSDGVPAKGVLICDGEQFVKTDAKGRYKMKSTKVDSIIFAVTPSGTTAELKDNIQPGFWAALTSDAKNAEVHDFSFRSEDQSTYSVFFAPDLHLGAVPHRHEIQRFTEDVLPKVKEWAEEFKKKGPVYTMALGDITQDKFWYEYGFNGIDGYTFLDGCGYPTPMYVITGNHDNDGAVSSDNTDFDAAWQYRKTWGPDKYSVNIGGDHWIFMDNILYVNDVKEDLKSSSTIHNYEVEFTGRQMDWLAKDLEFVSDTTQIYLCVHVPFVNSIVKGNIKHKREQIEEIFTLMSRFVKDPIFFSGHIHLFDFMEFEEFPRLHQFNLPAASGDMWETLDGHPVFGGDGADGGMYTATFKPGGGFEGKFLSYVNGEKSFRVYDMNTVGDYCNSSPDFEHLKTSFKGVDKYGTEEFQNKIMVNYWCWQPGDKVEILEDGKPMEVSRIERMDPIHAFTYLAPRARRGKGAAKKKPVEKCIHMFESQANAPDSQITVRITGGDGQLKYEETLTRPKSFSIDMK
ncbi:MAG: calcineurin-like phosphoesterase family protein [Bacteroidales bacterium]|nr:calcineurin-like phosphoesterase family protein [Bacteroidales bacterium]